MKNILSCTLVAVLISLVSQEAFAFNTQNCSGNTRKWTSNSLTYYYDDSTRPNNNIDYAQILSEVADVINNTYGIDFDLEIINGTGGKNTISFVSTLPSGRLGSERTQTQSPCFGTTSARFRESDITFNRNVDWDDSPVDTQFSGSPYNFRLVALHEIIHGIGLRHYNEKIAVMNEFYSNGGTIGYQHLAKPYTDDVKGMRRMYPGGNVNRGFDLHVSKFKKVPSFDLAVLGRVKRRSNNQEVTTLLKGEQYFVDYLVENSGAFDVPNAEVRFYLSTDGYIDSNDISIRAIFIKMDARTSRQSSVLVRIPDSIASGQYYLGYVVDPNNSIPEDDKEDNRVHLNLPGGGGTFTVQ